VTITTSANTVYGLDVTADVYALDGFPGMPVTYTLHITNTGNTTDTFDILAVSKWDVNVAGTIGPLAKGESVSVTVVFTLPVLVPSGTSNAAVIEVTSQGNPTRWQDIILITTARWNGVWIPIVVK
jgi:uncharacterized membrane protein